MGILLKEIADFMEEWAPLHLAEDYDNVGLLVGSRKTCVKNVMVCLDVTNDVVDEAVRSNINLIISHHPLIFKGIKRINEDDFQGGIIYKLIRNNIGVYSAHTNLDCTQNGVNENLARSLELQDIKILKSYKVEKLYKVVIFVPEGHEAKVREAIGRAGGGFIGNYSDCTFMIQGTGTFRPLNGSNPYIGTSDKLERVEEFRIETVVSQKDLNSVLNAMRKVHPYEEIAYDVYPLEINAKEYGHGNVGVLKNPLTLAEFVEMVKKNLNIENLRIIGEKVGVIKNVAVYCGSFDPSIISAVKAKADILVTGDVKYHDALDMVQMGMCAVDGGHHNTERIILPILKKKLSEKFQSINVIMNDVEKDPFKIC